MSDFFGKKLVTTATGYYSSLQWELVPDGLCLAALAIGILRLTFGPELEPVQDAVNTTHT
jgi:hypothetical protein